MSCNLGTKNTKHKQVDQYISSKAPPYKLHKSDPHLECHVTLPGNPSSELTRRGYYIDHDLDMIYHNLHQEIHDVNNQIMDDFEQVD